MTTQNEHPEQRSEVEFVKVLAAATVEYLKVLATPAPNHDHDACTAAGKAWAKVATTDLERYVALTSIIKVTFEQVTFLSGLPAPEVGLGGLMFAKGTADGVRLIGSEEVPPAVLLAGQFLSAAGRSDLDMTQALWSAVDDTNRDVFYNVVNQVLHGLAQRISALGGPKAMRRPAEGGGDR